MTGQHLVLLLWTVWLVVALVSVGGRPGAALLLVVGGLGLGLVLTGLVSWRAFLIAALAVHVLAAASRAFSQLTAVQPRAQALARPPLELTAAVQPGPHAPAASARHRSLGALPAFVPRWPVQVLAGSVSLAGVIWLLILRPAVPWLYRADIPIMIGTVAGLAAAEYGCWRFYKHLDRRLTETMKQLQEERQLRQDSDTRNHERSEWLEKRLELTESELSQRRDELSQAQADFRRAQDGLRHAQDRLGHAQEELRHMQADLRQAHNALRQAQGELPAGPGEPPQAQGELPAAPDEPPQAPGEPPPAQASTPPQDDGGDAPQWYRAAADVRARAEPDQAADAGSVRIELIRIVRLNPPPVGPGSRPGRSGIAIERGTVPITPEPGETVRHLTRNAEERLGREIKSATAQYAAETLGEPAWTVVSQRWVATGSAGFDAAARSVADFDADLHNILLDRPVQQLSSWAGLPGPESAVLGGIAGAAGLPGDRALNAVTEIIEVGGIVVGLALGHPVLVSACFKSLVHGQFIGALRAGIENTLSGPDVSMVSERAAPDPAAGRGAVQREAATRQGLEAASRTQEAAQRETAARQARFDAERQARLNAERQARLDAERQARLDAERTEAARRAAALFRHDPHDPPDLDGPAAGRISPFG